MNVDGVNNGIVIDHISAGRSMEIYHYLHLEEVDSCVAIIKNVQSTKYGKKDIIKVDEIIEYMKKKFSPGNKVDLTDGMKILFSDGGWVLLRPSGTEPIFRIYSESKNKELAEKRCGEFESAAKAFMGSEDGSE